MTSPLLAFVGKKHFRRILKDQILKKKSIFRNWSRLNQKISSLVKKSFSFISFTNFALAWKLFSSFCTTALHMTIIRKSSYITIINIVLLFRMTFFFKNAEARVDKTEQMKKGNMLAEKTQAHHHLTTVILHQVHSYTATITLAWFIRRYIVVAMLPPPPRLIDAYNYQIQNARSVT